MKYFLILFTLLTANLKAQNVLKFDKGTLQCLEKWIAYPIDKDGAYILGFLYIDAQAGLTLNYEGKFKIDTQGKFVRTDSEIEKNARLTNYRLKPNKLIVAEIPESKYKELNVEKFPAWLQQYKIDEYSIEILYRLGYTYNAWNEFEKALIYLQKADNIDSKFEALQTELAFTYNALGKFDKAEIALKKALVANPEDCYGYKELAYTYTKMENLQKVAATYEKMSKICNNQDFLQEISHNLAYEYYIKKDKIKFNKWKIETEKWSKSLNQYTVNLNKMEVELGK